jgi:tetratricopeptide (TPR) repeat protein
MSNRQFLLLPSLLFSIQLICSFTPAYPSPNSIPQEKEKKIDSLKQVINTTQEDSTITKAYNDLSTIFNSMGKYDTARGYNQKAIRKAKNIDYQSEIAQAYLTIGLTYHRQSDYKRALKFYRKSLHIYQETGNHKGVADINGNLGVLYMRQGKYDKALKLHQKGLKLQEKYGYTEDKANSYGNIGLIHWKQGNYQQAIKYFQKSLSIKKKVNNVAGMASSYNNIGIIYYEKERLDSSVHYFKKSLEIKKKLGNQLGIASTYNNLGGVYSKLFKQEIQTETSQLGARAFLDSAQFYHKKALHIQRKLGILEKITHSLLGLGKILISKQTPRRAISYFEEAVRLADSIGARSQQFSAYKGLSNCYEDLNNIPKAYLYYKKYSKVKDSVHNIKSRQKIAELEEKYKAEKRERRIETLKKEKKYKQAQLQKNRLMLYSAGGGLLLVLIFSGILYNRFRVTREQKNIIVRQKTTVEKQKELVENKNKQITDSINYAQRIQSAILQADSEQNKIGNENYFIIFKPKEAVSGDFYKAYHNKIELIWTAADCTGHGVPGAFMSMIGNRLMNEVVIEKQINDTGEILNQLRAGIIDTLQQKGKEGEMQDGMDMALCKMQIEDGDNQTRHVEFSGAKNPLYVVGKDIADRKVAQKADKTQGTDLIEIAGDKQPPRRSLPVASPLLLLSHTPPDGLRPGVAAPPLPLPRQPLPTLAVCARPAH